MRKGSSLGTMRSRRDAVVHLDPGFGLTEAEEGPAVVGQFVRTTENEQFSVAKPVPGAIRRHVVMRAPCRLTGCGVARNPRLVPQNTGTTALRHACRHVGPPHPATRPQAPLLVPFQLFGPNSRADGHKVQQPADRVFFGKASWIGTRPVPFPSKGKVIQQDSCIDPDSQSSIPPRPLLLFHSRFSRSPKFLLLFVYSRVSIRHG